MSTVRTSPGPDVAGEPLDFSTNAKAPLQIELRFQLNLSRPRAFELFVYRLPEWFGAVHKVSFDNARSERGPSEVGACSTRVCSMGSKALVEEIVALEPGRGYAYSADLGRSTMKMPIRDHLGTLDIEDANGLSIVTWRQYFRSIWPVSPLIRWYMRDRLMKPALRVLFQKYGGEPLAGF